MSPPPAAAGSDDELERAAWRVLLAAAQWSRRHGETAGQDAAFRADTGGRLVPENAVGAKTWLLWQPDIGWAMGPGVPDAAHALFDLYLPICAVSPQRPLTVGHLGQSLDGYIATGSGDSYYVTGPANVRHLHRLRALCDAVVVGAETVARDDPQLTVRQVEGANPVRVILDPRARLGPDRRVFSDGAAPTVSVASEGAARAALASAEVLAVPSAAGRLRLDLLLRELHARGMYSVFVEGGGSTVSAFLEAELLDRLHIAVAPLLTGSGRPGIRLPARDRIADCTRPAHRVFLMGGDVLFDCDLQGSAATPAAVAPGTAVRRVL